METSDAGYSVLMAVYAGSDSHDFKEALSSIFTQTLPSDDVVLVEDGPLTPELYDVVDFFLEQQPSSLHVLKLDKNMGLGIALNKGLASCKHDIVARMDSDDLSMPERCAKQYEEFMNNPNLSLLSSNIVEFVSSTFDQTGKRNVPATNEAIRKYSRKRSPINHPAVMFRKSAVEAAGGYTEDFHLFEDYHLWVRMLMNGCEALNIQEPLLYMRTTDDMYMRRGGKQYAADMLRFHKWLLESGWSKKSDYYTGAIPHSIVCRLPNFMRKAIYKILH